MGKPLNLWGIIGLGRLILRILGIRRKRQDKETKMKKVLIIAFLAVLSMAILSCEDGTQDVFVTGGEIEIKQAESFDAPIVHQDSFIILGERYIIHHGYVEYATEYIYYFKSSNGLQIISTIPYSVNAVSLYNVAVRFIREDISNIMKEKFGIEPPFAIGIQAIRYDGLKSNIVWTETFK